jgi:hypothetical protein
VSTAALSALAKSLAYPTLSKTPTRQPPWKPAARSRCCRNLNHAAQATLQPVSKENEDEDEDEEEEEEEEEEEAARRDW